MRRTLALLVLVCVGCGDDSGTADRGDEGDVQDARVGHDAGMVKPQSSQPGAGVEADSGSTTDTTKPDTDSSQEAIDSEPTAAVIESEVHDSGADSEPTQSSADPDTTSPETTDPETTDPGTTDPGTTDAEELDPIFGDIGAQCEPALDSADCEVACLGLSDGSGTCIDVCKDQGTCPNGFACNTVPYEGALYDICLPNASCGELDYKGECQGQTLRFCGTEGPIELNCDQQRSPTGSPLTCGLVGEELGYDCISAEFTGGCSQETQEGRCDGDTLVYCMSQESGEVASVDCTETGLACGLGPNGYAYCLEAGATGCGAVTQEGQCEGSQLTFCQDSEIVTGECDDTCQWASEEVGYNCVVDPGEAGSSRVYGVFGFEKPTPTIDGLGEVVNMPARHVLVRIRDAATNSELGRTYTNEGGEFDVSFDASGDVYLEVRTVGDPALYPMNVRDCPTLECQQDAIYAVQSAAFAPAPELDFGISIVSLDIGAGAFNIFDQVARGFDFARANFGATPPYAIVRWADGEPTVCGDVSCFVPQLGTLFIKGNLQDSDQFDDSVVLHEFGHYLENAFSRSDNPGGPHDGSATDPRLAWGEGYGTYVGARIADSPLYIDTDVTGGAYIDLRDVGEELHASPTDVRGMNQLVSELLVGQLLWQVDDGIPNTVAGHGSESTFDVLGHYFPAPEHFSDRGVTGVDLVDFLDGWFCRGHEDADGIRTILTGAGFPYDFASLPSCL